MLGQEEYREKYLLSISSRAAINAGVSHRWIPEEKETVKPHSKCAKVLLHNACYYNLHYPINGDLGGLLIKMSLPRRQNPAVTSQNLN